MTLSGVRGVVLHQFKSLVLEVTFGANYHGIHAFCIFSMKIPFFGYGNGKLKRGSRNMGAAKFVYML